MRAKASSPSAMSWAGRAASRRDSASSSSTIATNESRVARQGQGMREASSATSDIWRSCGVPDTWWATCGECVMTW